MGSSGEWLEKALLELCNKKTGSGLGLELDSDLISGLVSYCECASPLDAKEYIDNIIGEEAGKGVTEEYLKRRGHSDIDNTTLDGSGLKLHAYVKPPSNESSSSGVKKPPKIQREAAVSSKKDYAVQAERVEPKAAEKGNSKKKKSGKVISLAEAAKGTIVYQQGKPCSCQARRHRLISNCLSCGKIVCEQEGEGPCNFCGALVLREGSSYAGLEVSEIPLSDTEVAAQAYAKRLVDYDRNSAARTTVIDDQSDYYNIEGNSWISPEEKELLRKKQEEIEEDERAKRSKVVMTFDLVGRKVLMNEDEISEEFQNSLLLRPADEREANRIKPNPSLTVQPVFVDPGPSKKSTKGSLRTGIANGLCLEISGRIQHDSKELSIL
ncbi:hypothetical protein ACET3Z_017313 [Daucus carota]